MVATVQDYQNHLLEIYTIYLRKYKPPVEDRLRIIEEFCKRVESVDILDDDALDLLLNLHREFNQRLSLWMMTDAGKLFSCLFFLFEQGSISDLYNLSISVIQPDPRLDHSTAVPELTR